jgi:hypothetical protein
MLRVSRAAYGDMIVLDKQHGQERMVAGMGAKRSLVELIDAAAARHGGVSGRRLAQIAQEAGHDITHATLNRIRQDTYLSRPSVASVRAIAYLANVSEDTAFAAAGVTLARTGEPWHPPVEADRLDARQRKALSELIRAVVPDEVQQRCPFAPAQAAQIAHSRDRLRAALLASDTGPQAGGEVAAAAIDMVMCLDAVLDTGDAVDVVWAQYLACRDIDAPVEVWDR